MFIQPVNQKLQNTLAAFLLVVIVLFVVVTNTSAVYLHDEGVHALKSDDFTRAIDKFKAALRIDPSYSLARENLATASNDYALTIDDKPEEALKALHMAAFLDPDKTTVCDNINALLKHLGVNPVSSEVRTALGDKAKENNDFAGAIVEYRISLKLKNDPVLRKRLQGVNIPDQWQKVIESALQDSTTSRGEGSEVIACASLEYDASGCPNITYPIVALSFITGDVQTEQSDKWLPYVFGGTFLAVIAFRIFTKRKEDKCDPICRSVRR